MHSRIVEAQETLLQREMVAGDRRRRPARGPRNRDGRRGLGNVQLGTVWQRDRRWPRPGVRRDRLLWLAAVARRFPVPVLPCIACGRGRVGPSLANRPSSGISAWRARGGLRPTRRVEVRDDSPTATADGIRDRRTHRCPSTATIRGTASQVVRIVLAGQKAAQGVRTLRAVRGVALLLVRVPLGRRKILAQCLRRASRTVAGGIALNAPPVLQRTRIHGVEPELVEQTCNGGLGLRVVAGDDQCPTILRAGRSSVGRKLSGADVVERLDDL